MYRKYQKNKSRIYGKHILDEIIHIAKKEAEIKQRKEEKKSEFINAHYHSLG